MLTTTFPKSTMAPGIPTPAPAPPPRAQLSPVTYGALKEELAAMLAMRERELAKEFGPRVNERRPGRGHALYESAEACADAGRMLDKMLRRIGLEPPRH